jgi:hypothetical protein
LGKGDQRLAHACEDRKRRSAGQLS